MALVGEAVRLVPLWDRLHVRLFPALSLVGIQNLNVDREQTPSEAASKNMTFCNWAEFRRTSRNI